MPRLLLLGPLPPPVGGATRNIEIFLQETEKIPDLDVVVVNTSPGDYRQETKLFALDTFDRMWRVLRGFLTHVQQCDSVLLLGRASFIFTMGSLLLVVNRLYRKPFFIKPFGSELHLALEHGWISRLGKWFLPLATGLFLQTQYMQKALQEKGFTNAYYIPGYRLASTLPQKDTFSPANHLEIIYVGQVKISKGVLDLLEALRLLVEQLPAVELRCHFYGPVFEEDKVAFETAIAQTPNASYKGVLQAPEVLSTIRNYDVLILPTRLLTEGHPGVLLEAMQVGVPVITTQFLASRELVTSGENGLIVPIEDSVALAEAIKTLSLYPDLLVQMGQCNYERRQEFDASTVIRQMLTKLFQTSLSAY